MTPARRLFWAGFALLVVFKLWLLAGLPVFAIASAKPDDQLFVRLAQSILRGEWLGPYDELTLAKGAGYSLWMAANFYVGLPLTLAQHLAYAAACLLVVLALRPLLRSDGIALLIFAALWWNPMSYEMGVLGRILRQNLYTPLSLTLFASVVAVMLRVHAPGRGLFGWALLAGLSFGGFWLTREEGLWLAPALALLAATAGWKAWRARRLPPFAAALVVAAVSAAAPITTVSWLNWRHYGWFGTVEFRAPEFLHAYGALSRVRSTAAIPLVPLPREARLRLYAVSPAFAELQPFLEGDIGHMAANCSAPFTGHPAQEMEMAGGWFMWALREAVVKAGHGASARDALQFYDRLAREIDTACDRGLVEAGPPRATMAPVWRPGYLRRFREQFIHFADYAASFAGFNTGPVKSFGAPDQIAMFRDVTRSRLAPWADGPEMPLPLQARLDETKREILHRIGKVTRRLFFFVALAGLAAWALLGLQMIRRRQLLDFWVIGAALIAAFGTNVAIVALIDISSFPAQNPGYFAHVYPLVILFGFASCYGAWMAFRPEPTPPRAAK